MPSPFPENLALRKTRLLTQALILSGMLNIGLLSTFIYVVLREKQESLAIELKPLKDQPSSGEQISNAALLKAYSLLPFQELLLRLENKERVEEGLYKRDLALSCLTAFHHFNLDKALSGFPLQKRSILFANADGQEKIELPIYPGLADDQFQAVLRYAKTEKWPLSCQGLFYELQRLYHNRATGSNFGCVKAPGFNDKKGVNINSNMDPFFIVEPRELIRGPNSNLLPDCGIPHPRDVSLVEAFCLSAEYQAAHTLFFKTAVPLSCECLLDLLCEGDWKILSELEQTQRAALDLSPDRRRAFLFAYLDCHSKTAAKLLLETDLEFVLKRCDDGQILTLLDLFDEKSTYLDNFAKALLASVRTDTVWKRAAAALYALALETMPEPYDHRIVLQRFFPKESAPPTLLASTKETPPSNRPPLKPGKKLYIVENGDNLWKISRKFHVSIEEIMKANHLETEKLRPGKQLEIPVKENN